MTGQPHKPSLLVMKEEIVQDKTQISDFNQTVTANRIVTVKGVMIGTIWCLMVTKVSKKLSQFMKDQR